MLTLSIKSKQKISQIWEKSCLSRYKRLIDGTETPCHITVKALGLERWLRGCIHIGQLTNTCTYSLRGSDTTFWHLQLPIPISPYLLWNIFFKNIFKHKILHFKFGKFTAANTGYVLSKALSYLEKDKYSVIKAD